MKLLVVLALLGFAAAVPRRGGEHVNFCRGNSQARSDAEAIRAVIVTYLPSIIGHCPTAASAIAAGTFFSKNCVQAFDQGFCYVSGKVSEYNLEDKLSECTGGEGEETTSTTTFKDMAMVLAANGDVHKLGHLGCAHALPCFEHIVSQIAECAANDEDFYSVALDNVVNLVVPIINANSESAEEFVACHFGAESDAMTILGLVQDRITSFDDIVALFNEYFSEDDQAAMAKAAKKKLYGFIQGAKDFCGAGCVRKTARYFRSLFHATHDKETCPVVGLYCGGCQDNADAFIASETGAVPCCTQDALDSITDAIYNMVASYSDIASDIESDVKAAAKAAGISTAAYEAMKELGKEQLACVEESYDTLADSDCV